MDAKAWASTLRATRPWRHNLWALPLVRCKTIDPYSTTSSESQESYLTTVMLPYKHSSFLQHTHGSIMLPPCQPRVFVRLARWQQLAFPFPVKQCLNITRESEKLNIFWHVDTMFTPSHIVSAGGDWYEHCGCVGVWAKHGICRQRKALRKASRK